MHWLLWLFVHFCRAEFNETCNALEEAEKCEQICYQDLWECLDQCAADSDINCHSTCLRQSTACDEKCPCNVRCPHGCPCDTWECSCEKIDANKEHYSKCAELYLAEFSSCSEQCVFDVGCLEQCSHNYENNLKNCPCQEYCVSGCPCEQYVCADVPVHADEKFLIISTYTGNNALVFDWTSEIDNVEMLEDFTFEDQTQVRQSCSLLYKNEMLVLGGQDYSRAISKVRGCALSRVGNLRFDFDFGACIAATIDSVESVFMCFPLGRGRSCWRLSGVEGNWATEEEKGATRGNHYLGVLSTWNNKPMAIAGSETLDVEHYDFTSWAADAEYYPGGFLQWSTSVNFMGDVYVFGGYSYPRTLQSVWRFNGKWQQMQDLLEPRRGHNAIVSGDEILIVGGYQRQSFESWKFVPESGNFEQKASDQTLYNYAYYPAVFAVDVDAVVC